MSQEHSAPGLFSCGLAASHLAASHNKSVIWREGQVTGLDRKKTYLLNAMDGGSGSLTSMLNLNIMAKCQTVV